MSTISSSTPTTPSSLGPDELRVAVEAVALTAADLVAPGGAAVGRVVAAGAAATHRLGERVLVGPVASCFECDVCRRGHPAVCPRRVAVNALAGEVVTRARSATGLVGLLEGAAPGPEAALLAREAPLAYEMFVRAGVAPGEVTVWVGGGPVAALGLAIARAKGATAFTAEDYVRGELPPRVFEVSGRADGRAQAAELAGPGATLVLRAGDATPLPARLLDDEVTVVGVAGAHPDLVPELCALVARGEVSLAGISPLRAWEEADAILASGASAIVVR